MATKNVTVCFVRVKCWHLKFPLAQSSSDDGQLNMCNRSLQAPKQRSLFFICVFVSLPFHVLQQWGIKTCPTRQGCDKNDMQTFLWPPEVQAHEQRNMKQNFFLFYFLYNKGRKQQSVFMLHIKEKRKQNSGTMCIVGSCLRPVVDVSSAFIWLAFSLTRPGRRACVRQSVGHKSVRSLAWTRTHAR